MLKVDGIEYRVHAIIPTLVNSFELDEGENSGKALSRRIIRDIGGTRYPYTLEVEPSYEFPEDFDALFDVLSAPVDSHIVSLPYGQGSIEFEAMIQSGSRTYYGKRAGKNRWKHMEIEFIPIEPQRKPGEAWPPTV